MHDVIPFAVIVASAALALLAATGSSRLRVSTQIPTPASYPHLTLSTLYSVYI